MGSKGTGLNRSHSHTPILPRLSASSAFSAVNNPSERYRGRHLLDELRAEAEPIVHRGAVAQLLAGADPQLHEERRDFLLRPERVAGGAASLHERGRPAGI